MVVRPPYELNNHTRASSRCGSFVPISYLRWRDLPRFCAAACVDARALVSHHLKAASIHRFTPSRTTRQHTSYRKELGYWNEEKEFGTRCAGAMDGQSRLDLYMSHMPG